MTTSLRRLLMMLAVVAVVGTTGCGDDDGDSGDSEESTAESNESPSTTTAPEKDAAPTLTVKVPDCATLEPTATALVGPGSSVDPGKTLCQFFGQTSSSGAGTGWRIYVKAEQVRYPELDFEQAISAGFSSSEGMVEADAPEGWSFAATRSSQTPDPDFPEGTSEQFLYFGGPDVAGLLTCQIELSSRGETGAAPPAPPAIDQEKFLTFCNTAKDQAVVDAE